MVSAAGGKIDWGHLAAGTDSLRAAFEGQQGQQYDMVEDDPDARPMPGAGPSSVSAPLAPLGRGSAATQPAWMTSTDAAAAPGSAGM